MEPSLMPPAGPTEMLPHSPSSSSLSGLVSSGIQPKSHLQRAASPFSQPQLDTDAELADTATPWGRPPAERQRRGPTQTRAVPTAPAGAHRRARTAVKLLHAGEPKLPARHGFAGQRQSLGVSPGEDPVSLGPEQVLR